MRASEVLKKPGDAARRESDGAIVVQQDRIATNSVYNILHVDGNFHSDSLLSEIGATGDDWQPLLPAIPIEELRKVTAYGDNDERIPAVLLSDLQSIVPARACDCEARVRELEGIKQSVGECNERQAQIIGDLQCENASLRTELATLREQKWVLGEPLNSQAFDALDESTPLIVERFDGTLWQTVKSRFDWDEEDDYFRCLFVDPRPLPTLAEPEVPAVPKWLRPEGLIGAVELKKLGYVFLGFASEILDGDLLVIDSDQSQDTWAAERCTIYTGPVRWPDGTIKPIEPTPELLAALNESEATE